MHVLSLFNTQSIKEVTKIDVNISAEMNNAILLCNSIMTHSAPWNKYAPSCGLSDHIAGMIAETIKQEIGLQCPDGAIKQALTHLNANVSSIAQYIALLGGCVVRPIFANDKLQYELIPLGNYLPLSYDFDGTLLSALILKQLAEGKNSFLLVEKHDFKNGAHSVENTLYRNLGGYLQKTALSACSITASISPAYVWQNVKAPMLIEFRSHIINKIDGSNVPVALIYSAIELLEEADRHFHRMSIEQSSGERRIFADRDMFQKRQTRNGDEVQTRLTPELKNLIVQIDSSAESTEKIKDFTPALRTTAQVEYMQQVLRRIETAINIGKGALSDLESAQQTATQYNGGKKSYYSIIDTIEDEIEQKYKACAHVFDHIAQAYDLGATKLDEVKTTWNDEVRKDPLEQKTQALNEIAAGVMSVAEYRQRFFNEDEATAKAKESELQASRSAGAFVM